MLDIQLIRDKSAEVVAGLSRRGLKFDFGEALDWDRERRETIVSVEERRRELNEVSKSIPQRKKAGEDVAGVMAAMKTLREGISADEKQVGELDEKLREFLLGIPNLPAQDVPDGTSEKQNVEVRRWGEPRVFDFEAQSHDVLGEKLGLMSSELGVKLAKSRFTLLRGAAARLERVLINFMLDRHTGKGYEEILPPYMANSASLTGTGQLPKFEADLFALRGEDLYLIPTAEVPLTNIPAGTTIKNLARGRAIMMTAHTPCFRSEAGSYGKDTRGYIRQHQFNKVELVKVCHPEDSPAELESLTADAEGILQALELPYRVVALCAGDMGFSATKTYDIEVWLPSQKVYREISSCSNFSDYQARRAGIRFKDAETGKSRFAHTLNGSGLAVGRTLVAIFENFQTKDGNIRIPGVLRKDFGGREFLVAT